MIAGFARFSVAASITPDLQGFLWRRSLTADRHCGQHYYNPAGWRRRLHCSVCDLAARVAATVFWPSRDFPPPQFSEDPRHTQQCRGYQSCYLTGRPARRSCRGERRSPAVGRMPRAPSGNRRPQKPGSTPADAKRLEGFTAARPWPRRAQRSSRPFSGRRQLRWFRWR